MDTRIQSEKTEPIDHDSLTRELAAFQHPSRLKSSWQLVNTLVPYVGLWALAYYALQYSFWAALPVILLNAGFLVRIFIIFHDCGHGTFFRSKKANRFWGVITGVLTFTPYYFWTAAHAKHHATSGNLDKRGSGDVWLMTVDEYLKASKSEKFRYRFYRNPFVMFILGPLYLALVSHRFLRRKAKRKEQISIHGTNLGILIVAVAASFLMGWKDYLIIQSLIVFLGLVGGVWLFYVQHQFEGVYWSRGKEWDFVKASLEGGSFYQLPAVLRWFSGNIGYHHVHHLNPRIPNYRLPKCHNQIPVLAETNSVRLIPSLKSITFRLYDEEEGKLVGFGAVKRRRRKMQASAA
ncbi:MAG: fatty acid desaturase [candidate division Zixibacteria bacterium]|nr:fatty acid desaturase [candidate division Zixibacteria bacterium]